MLLHVCKRAQDISRGYTTQLYLGKSHVTRPGNFSYNFRRNEDDCKTLQVAEGLSHVRNTFSQLAMRPLEMINSSSCRHLEISREAQKTRSNWLIFTKLRCKLRWTCHTQQLVSQCCEKLRIALLFLQLTTQHYVSLKWAGYLSSPLSP